jgi:hypothetical protein
MSISGQTSKNVQLSGVKKQKCGTKKGTCAATQKHLE